jgi:hypothetical protein
VKPLRTIVNPPLAGGDSARSAPVPGRSLVGNNAGMDFSSAPAMVARLCPGGARSAAGLIKIPFLGFVVFAPAKIFACAACYGANIDDRMADGMNWAILTLGAIVATVLGAFLTFLIYAIRKSEALTAAAEQENSPQGSKV